MGRLLGMWDGDLPCQEEARAPALLTTAQHHNCSPFYALHLCTHCFVMLWSALLCHISPCYSVISSQLLNIITALLFMHSTYVHTALLCHVLFCYSILFYINVILLYPHNCSHFCAVHFCTYWCCALLLYTVIQCADVPM